MLSWLRPLLCVGLLLAGPGLHGWSAEPEPTRGDRMLDAYFRHETQRLADACLAGIRTREDWEKHRPELRRQFLDMMGLWPLPPRTDLKPVITGTLDSARFRVEKLHFQSSPGLYVTGNLYVPRGLTAPAPAILYVCGHANTVQDGISYGSKVNYQHHPAWFAEHGYVCLILDTLQLGEIQGIHHGTSRLGMWWWQSLGYTPAGVECWNAMRALDYLESRPEVDRKRLGVTGRSGGGATSWWLAAADDRPQCIIPVAGIADLHAHVVEGLAPRLRKGVIAGHCDCMYFVNTYRWDFPLVLALCAPRPLLLGNSDQDDIFPVPGYQRMVDKVRRIYDLYDARDKFALLETAGPHKDTPELRQGAFRWMNRWLKGEPGDTSDPDREKFTPRQLQVFEQLPADQVNTIIQERFVQAAHPELPRSPAVTREWWARKRPDWLRAIRESVFGGWPETPPSLDAKLAAEVLTDDLRLRAFDFTSQVGVELRLWLLTARNVARPTRTVLSALDEPGWKEWAESLGPAFQQALQLDQAPVLNEKRFQQIRKALEEDKQAVAVIAPRGIGPSRWSDADGPTGVQVRRRFPLLGQTLDGQRAWDVRRSLEVLRGVPEAKGVPLELEGRGDMAGIVLYAALFEPDVAGLTLHHPTPSHRQGPILLNVRRILDMPQAVALAFPRPVRLHVKEEAEARAWDWPIRLQQALGEEYLKFCPARD
jgi:hypothetical protein